MRRLLAPFLLLFLVAACTPGEPFAVFEARTDLVRAADLAAGRLSQQLHQQGQATKPIRLRRLEAVAGAPETPLSEILLEQVAASLARRGHTIDRSGSLSIPDLLFQGAHQPRDLTLRGEAVRLELGGSYAAAQERVFISLYVDDVATRHLVAAHDFEISQDKDVRALLVSPQAQRYKRDLAGNYYRLP